jgi:hypothetical protein
LISFLRYENIIGDFNAKVGRENIFKTTIENEGLHEIINDNGVRAVNFASFKKLVVKSTTFPHSDVHKYTWTSPEGNTHNQTDHVLIEVGVQAHLMSDLSEGLTAILTTIW